MAVAVRLRADHGYAQVLVEKEFSMAFSFSPASHKPASRRLRPVTIARRCVGGLIMLAGASILTMDMIALASGAQHAPASSPAARSLGPQ